jgi:hypothetical protein
MEQSRAVSHMEVISLHAHGLWSQSLITEGPHSIGKLFSRIFFLLSLAVDLCIRSIMISNDESKLISVPAENSPILVNVSKHIFLSSRQAFSSAPFPMYNTL